MTIRGQALPATASPGSTPVPSQPWVAGGGVQRRGGGCRDPTVLGRQHVPPSSSTFHSPGAPGLNPRWCRALGSSVGTGSFASSLRCGSLHRYCSGVFSLVSARSGVLLPEWRTGGVALLRARWTPRPAAWQRQPCKDPPGLLTKEMQKIQLCLPPSAFPGVCAYSLSHCLLPLPFAYHAYS